MLTGDNKLAAKSVADEIGIDYVYSNLMPEDKLNILDTIRNKFGDVAMVGDGINDAPAWHVQILVLQWVQQVLMWLLKQQMLH